MARPRPRSRSNRLSCAERPEAPARLDTWPPDDPGRLVELSFVDGPTLDDPETIILAWLAVLPNDLAPPVAAERLCKRLTTLGPARLNAHQSRLLSLLHFIASHRRPQREA